MRRREDYEVTKRSNIDFAGAVLSIAQIDANALVAMLPSDHHYSDESLFASALESVFISAAEFPGSVVLLGGAAGLSGNGWIELGEPLRAEGRAISGEKPPLEIARRLWLNQDSVWNTFVMVGRVKAFLEMLHAALPELTAALATATLWKGRGTHIEHSLYKRMPSSDLSKHVLSAETKRLLVLRLGEVGLVRSRGSGKRIDDVCGRLWDAVDGGMATDQRYGSSGMQTSVLPGHPLRVGCSSIPRKAGTSALRPMTRNAFQSAPRTIKA
jgi:hypothetical protein